MSVEEDYVPIFTCEADFEKIWRRDDQVKSKCFSDVAGELVAHSFVFKSFRNEYETEHLFSKSWLKKLKSGEFNFDNLVPKQESEKPTTVPGYTPESFIPTTSELTKKEMSDCFTMYKNICENKPLSNEMLVTYNELMPKIHKEQKNYQTVAKEAWFRINKERLNEIKPEVVEFSKKLWKERLERVSWYPKHYVKVTDISLFDVGENKTSNMTHTMLSKHVGLLPLYNIPNLKINKLNMYDSFVEELKKEDEDQISVNNSYKPIHQFLFSMEYHPDVSKDKIAESVALNNRAQIVLSASGFLHLLDNHPKNVGKTWNLPIVIKETSIGLEKRKVVYIDKALPEKSLTAVDRVKWFSKVHLKKLLKCGNKLAKNGRKLNETCYDDIIDYNISELETFGIDADNAEVTKTVTSPSSPCSESELIIDTNVSEQECENEDPVCSPLTQPKKQHVNQKLKEKICYNLWSLTSENSNMLLKSNLKSLDVLIRSKAGGRGKKKTDLLKLSPKLEYQTEYGAEAVTLSEGIQDWGNIFMRPAHSLLRARINPLTGDVVMFEEKTLQDLTNEMKRLHKFNPHSRLACIHMLFGKLLEFEPGNYLLSHSSESENFAQLYKSDTSKHTFNLSLSYQQVNPEEIALPRPRWCQIDQYIFTPTFLHFHRIPAMFHPKRAVPITSKLEVRLNKDVMKKRLVAKRRRRRAEKKKIEKQHMLKTISDSDT